MHSIILRPKKPLGSWNIVNPLLSMNEAWMDECAARLQLLVDQYKPLQHQTYKIEKFRDSIVTTWSFPWDKNISLKKENNDVYNSPLYINSISLRYFFYLAFKALHSPFYTNSFSI